MNRIKEIWHILESKSLSISGLNRIRYSDTSICDFYLGIKHPEGHRILIISAPIEIGKQFNFVYSFRGLKFEKIYDNENSNNLLLNLVLVDRQFEGVFDSLISDVINNIIVESNIKAVLKCYTNRLTKWQSLFEKFNLQGLSLEEQRGLFGELYFLRKCLNAKSNPMEIVSTWLGTERQVRDFQSKTWAVEVKTTHGNNHQKVHISSERQLDTTNLENLFLYHISLDQMQNSGETLNDIVDSVIEYLNSDALALNSFKSKIYEVGYFDFQRNLYEGHGYFIRNDTFYKVEGDFPRIQENEIKPGVGDVKYSIIVSQCLNFVRDEAEVFIKIGL